MTKPVLGRARMYRDATHTAGVGLAANVGLVAMKFVGGVSTGSAALVADAVNSLGDVGSSLIVRGALWVAQRDADEDHPYGHTKAESIAALTVALLIAFSATVLAVETIRQIGEGPRAVSISASIIALAGAVIKEGLYQYTRATASRLDSAVLRAAAWDHRADAIASAAIAGALIVGWWLGPSGWIADTAAALVVCVVLMVTGLRMYASTAAELMDQQADAALVTRIAAVARRPREVCDVETLRVRKSGLEYFVEIHIEVDGHLTVDAGHRVGHLVKDAVMAEFPRVRDVHVHVEPHHHEDPLGENNGPVPGQS